MAARSAVGDPDAPAIVVVGRLEEGPRPFGADVAGGRQGQGRLPGRDEPAGDLGLEQVDDRAAGQACDCERGTRSANIRWKHSDA